MKHLILILLIGNFSSWAWAGKSYKRNYYPGGDSNCRSILLDGGNSSSFKIETAKERAARKALEAKEEAKEKAAEARRAKQEEAARVLLVTKLKKMLKPAKLADNTQQARDLINYARLEHMLMDYDAPSAVSLLIGKPYGTKATAKEISRAKYLVNFALESHRFIIFDADSNLGNLISDLVGENGLGISAGEFNTKLPSNVIVIKNPYIRMQALSLPETVSVSHESVSGMGMVFNNMVTHHTSNDLSAKDSVDFSDWEPPQGERNFGIHLKKVKWLSFKKVEESEASVIPSVADTIDALSYDEISSILESQKLMNNAVKVMDEHQPVQGAVVFGSGGLPGSYTQRLYKIVRSLAQRGVPIYTGGAGGVMEVANQAAFDAGADSIGIGLGGRLITEKESKSSIHTLSLETSDYTERIPLLMRDRKIVLIAPGGMGTMKELATVLVAEAGHENFNTLIVLVGRKYYSKIYENITELLPAELAANIHLVDDEKELEAVLDQYTEKVWSAKEQKGIFTTEKPKPRNDNNNFEEPKPKKYDSDDIWLTKGKKTGLFRSLIFSDSDESDFD